MPGTERDRRRRRRDEEAGDAVGEHRPPPWVTRIARGWWCRRCASLNLVSPGRCVGCDAVNSRESSLRYERQFPVVSPYCSAVAAAWRADTPAPLLSDDSRRRTGSSAFILEVESRPFKVQRCDVQLTPRGAAAADRGPVSSAPRVPRLKWCVTDRFQHRGGCRRDDCMNAHVEPSARARVEEMIAVEKPVAGPPASSWGSRRMSAEPVEGPEAPPPPSDDQPSRCSSPAAPYLSDGGEDCGSVSVSPGR
eukprot:TRINITY_DN18583_c0_g1_i2.p1 TRINITY_DN18583_c0_g1~~TRINITY_DN18583_c0_g1_i2.p1  ORF type:complete len:264 (+),score=91.09 TRINITY_DN18583_c0_g1_i2:45-794(+)